MAREFKFADYELSSLSDDQLPFRPTMDVDKLTKILKLFKYLVGDDPKKRLNSSNMLKDIMTSTETNPDEIDRIKKLGDISLLDQFTRSNWNDWDTGTKIVFNLRREAANLPL